MLHRPRGGEGRCCCFLGVDAAEEREEGCWEGVVVVQHHGGGSCTAGSVMGVMCGMGRVVRGRRRGKKNTGIVRTLTQAPHFLFRFALPVREGWSPEVVGDLVSLLGWQRPRKWTEFTPRKINAVLADVISSAQWLHSFLSSTIVRVPTSHPG